MLCSHVIPCYMATCLTLFGNVQTVWLCRSSLMTLQGDRPRLQPILLVLMEEEPQHHGLRRNADSAESKSPKTSNRPSCFYDGMDQRRKHQKSFSSSATCLGLYQLICLAVFGSSTVILGRKEHTAHHNAKLELRVPGSLQ